VISWPTTEEQEALCHELIRVRNGQVLGPAAHFIVWVVDNTPVWVVAIDNWVGKTCQLSQANVGTRLLPREFARHVFYYVFDVLKMERVFALVDSENRTAIRVNRFVGFEEDFRWPGLGEKGDLIVFGLSRETCRFIGVQKWEKVGRQRRITLN